MRYSVDHRVPGYNFRLLGTFSRCGDGFDNSAHFWRAEGAFELIDVHLLTDINVSEEAVHQCYASGGVDIHEESCYHITNQESDYEGAYWGINFGYLGRPLSQDQVNYAGVSYSYEEFTDKSEDEPDSACEGEGHRVLEHEQESIHSSHAEALAGQHYLTVGILVDVLHKAMTAVEATSDTLHQACDRSRLFTSSSFHFLVNVLKDQSDDDHDGYQERTESQAAQVISEHPPVASADAVVTSRLLLVLTEVPGCHSHDLDILSSGHN
jgi:hypothetical protein